MAERTLYQMFLETTQAHGERNAVGFRTGKAAEYHVLDVSRIK